MAFCGHCGYQLSKEDKLCPQCGEETDINLADFTSPDPQAHQPTEISHAVLDYAPVSSPQNPINQPRFPVQQRPLVLGQGGAEQMANEATTMSSQVHPQMNQQAYFPQQSYPNYPQQGGPVTGFYHPGYNAAAGYQQAQSTAVAQLLESSRKGKTTSLLLILFGLLLLIGSILIFLLNYQGIIFA